MLGVRPYVGELRLRNYNICREGGMDIELCRPQRGEYWGRL